MHNHYIVMKTSEFESWFSDQQPKIRAIIQARLDLITVGHLGNHKRFDGLLELRWLNGTRLYAFIWDKKIVVILYGGNKNGQSKDIKKAKKIRQEILEGSYSLFK